MADAEGVVVGTGLVTVHGPAAWIGTVWVTPAWRSKGVGRALTQATMDAAAEAGAGTVVLVSSDIGRALYEKLGFEVQTWYRMMESPGLDGETPDPRVRPFAGGRPGSDGGARCGGHG